MYREQVEGQGSKPAPAVEIEGEQEWEVEKILNAKWFRGKKRIHHVLRDTGFQERELPNRFTAKVLFGWDDKQFDAEYLKKLERNWRTWRS
ncbi:hypothetical protein AGABI1DRAFT_135094 [Agaricus bisporus var. burnettii JB137-S8]|uniref:Uncharacterized protein n=1 Tax=Agaricus bisporus var. burnettii (strain JB137-S8 / ATCC MYA-4627 / FGSC 10392) TaxID=597362 RepID=K5VG50_AGABU|nr:uncharacterized protein AGABI1DRAFT_135094 [Agaricus bisporus var. burnettii JB137-S8]EKM73309.1 hypothetical protein AGABI1DRAFT_135094 [Agaricus bisporus var. burnettii JB137-S8]